MRRLQNNLDTNDLRYDYNKSPVSYFSYAKYVEILCLLKSFHLKTF